MRFTHQLHGIFAISLTMVCVLLLAGDRQHLWPIRGPSPDQPASLPLLLIRRQPPRSPFEVALRESVELRTRAWRQVNADREVLEAWDPLATEGPTASEWRRQQLAKDEAAYLRRARTEVCRATALARSPDEVYRAAECRSLIEHDVGNHQHELRQARLMMKLKPRNPNSLAVLRRAARCNGHKGMEDRTHGR